MQVVFDRLEIVGFRSIIAPLVVIFQGSGPGLYFVIGRNAVDPRLEANGVGKSSIFEAACWALYDRTSRKLRRPDIRPWGYDATTTVAVYVLVDGVRHTIQRTAAPNSLTLDGDTVAQEDIDRLIGMSYDLFINTVFLAQGMPLFLDMTAGEKLDLMSTALNLSRWDGYSKNASDEVDALSAEHAEAITDQTRIEAELVVVDRNISQLANLDRQWEADLSGKKKRMEAELKTVQDRLAKAQSKHDGYNVAYDGAMTELNQAQRDLSVTVANLHGVERNYVEFEAAVKQSAAKVLVLRKQIADLATSKVCPTCGQQVRAADLASHRDELRKSLADAERIVSQGIPRRTIEARDELRGTVDALAETARTFQTKADTARDGMLTLSAPIANDRATVAQLTRSLRERAESPYQEQLKTARNRKAELVRESTAQDRKVNDLAKAIERTKAWVKGFLDIKLNLIDDFLQELELAVNILLPDYGLEDWTVQFDVERESKSGTVVRGIHVLIKSQGNTEAVPWNVWSGGEAQRLRIVGALAVRDTLLRRVGVESSLLILDEPTRGLSPGGVGDLIDGLSDRASRENETVWLVDHVARPSSRFVETLHLVKTDAGTVLENS